MSNDLLLKRDHAGPRNGKPKPAPGKRRVRTLPTYRPFPVDALPDPLNAYVDQAAKALGCDPAYVALPALAAVASAIGNTRTIRLKPGWDEPCIFWTAVVGDSGTLKSPAYLKAVGYVFRQQKRLIQQHQADEAAYRERAEEYKAAKATWKNGDGEDPGDPPVKPALRRVVCSGTTIEKLAEILEDNPRGTLVARDQLAGWLGSFTRYKSTAGGTDLPNWLEMHRAGTVVVDRKTGERRTLFIPRAAVSVTGGIQPGVLAKNLTPEFLDAGLAARLLMGMPPRLPKCWSEVELSPEAEWSYRDLLDKLLALDFGTEQGEKAPRALLLSPDGQAAWVTFYDWWAREQAAVEGELAPAFSKLEGYVARFALLHHVVSRVAHGEDDSAPVGQESIEAAIVLCRWFAAEARRIYASLAETGEERDARRLVEFIRARGGSITARDLQRSNDRKYPSAEAAQAALDALAEDGLATWEEPGTTTRGGRPARRLRLRPTHDSTDTTGSDPDEVAQHAADTTPDAAPPNPCSPEERRSIVGCVGRRTDREGAEPAVGPGGGRVGNLVPTGWQEGEL